MAGRIFKNDFEEGNYSAWSGTTVSPGATLEIATTPVKKGHYSSKGIAGYNYVNAYVYKRFTPVTTVYARAYAYVSSININVSYSHFLCLADQYFSYVSIGPMRYAGKFYVSIIWRDHTGATHSEIFDTFPMGSWHFFEIMHKRHDTEGEIRAWFDGVEKIHVTNLNTSAQIIDRIRVNPGYSYFEPGGEITVFIDLVEVSDSYIGAYKPPALVTRTPHAF